MSGSMESDVVIDEVLKKVSGTIEGVNLCFRGENLKKAIIEFSNGRTEQKFLAKIKQIINEILRSLKIEKTSELGHIGTEEVITLNNLGKIRLNLVEICQSSKMLIITCSNF